MSSSSEDSGTDSSVDLSEVSGDSSDDGADVEAKVTQRAMCGQFVWPCPREYPSEIPARKKLKRLKPADMSKQDLGKLFKKVMSKAGHIVKHIHVFDEPHKKYNKKTSRRERHKHTIFKVNAAFAHSKVAKSLASHGVHGHFSFNLCGYAEYLNYMLEPSAKKLPADIDREPWSWPAVSVEALDTVRKAQSPQLAARNGKGRKRKLLTFSEFTDILIEGNTRSEKDAWCLAKERKLAGDDTLWNTLGSFRCVPEQVNKVLRAWACEDMSTGTLVTEPQYKLSGFVGMPFISPLLVQWVKLFTKKKTLILYGEGGTGKTEFACALMHKLCGTFHFINRLDRCKDLFFIPGQGLVADELRLADREIDDAKALLDVEKARDIMCRNKDGAIPKGTVRIITTNWPKESFWPSEAFMVSHSKAIERRRSHYSISSYLPIQPYRTLPTPSVYYHPMAIP